MRLYEPGQRKSHQQRHDIHTKAAAAVARDLDTACFRGT